MSALSNSEDELQDLSADDARELQAFLEKRRWFESKLKVLESLPPIYPFLHPVLASSGPSGNISLSGDDKIEYEVSKGVAFSLPTAEDIRKWRAERIALEEEVLAFDGGDLGRMKEKTRAVTLIPLTPPSTHLVSITLALIVLIDRLLTLLRQRSDLLELTNLRLQWDGLRWQIMQETARIRSEINEIAAEQGRWVPPAIKGAMSVQTPRRERMSTAGSIADNGGISNTPSAPGSAISSNLPTVSSVASSLSELSTSSLTPSKPNSEISRHLRQDSSLSLSSSRDTPKRALRLPLLHSHIVNLGVRHQNLSSNLVVRSGKVLDKMIDLAIPLKGLGGASGPADEVKGDGGAVPDELLDIQDDLEMGMGQLSRSLAWCKKLEDQWRRADEHYLSSHRARESGEQVMRDLLEAIARPATSEQHRHLGSLLQAAKLNLPPPVGADFSVPADALYPDHEVENTSMVEVLNSARSEAHSVFLRITEGLEWYEHLIEQSGKLQILSESVFDETKNLETALAALDDVRPNLSSPASLPRYSESWRDEMPGHVLGIAQARESLLEANQRLTLAVMRYRQIANAVPQAIRDDLTQLPPKDVGDEAEKAGEEAVDLSDRAVLIVRELEEDVVILPLLCGIIEAANDITSQFAGLHGMMDNQTLDAHSLHLVEQRLEGMLVKHEDHVGGPRIDVEARLREQARSIPALQRYLAETDEGITDNLMAMRTQYHDLQQAHLQREAVTAIESEAETFLARISAIVDAAAYQQETNDSNTAVEAIQVLAEDIRIWERGLADRAVFLAANMTTTAQDQHMPHAIAPLLSPTISNSAPPMTPPASPPRTPRSLTHDNGGQRRDRPALDLDNDARRRINEAVTRVKSAFSHLVERSSRLEASDDHTPLPEESTSLELTVAEDDVFGSPSIHTSGSSSADGVNGITIQQLRFRLEDLHFNDIVSPSETAMQVTPVLRQIPSSPIARRIRAELDSIVRDSGTIESRGLSTEEQANFDVLKTATADMTVALPRLEALASFSQAARACDAQFSRLLDALDTSAAQDELLRLKDKTVDDLVIAGQTVASLEDDPRVAGEMKRIDIAWEELEALVNDALDPGRQGDSDSVDDSLSETSIASSITSLPLSRLPMLRNTPRMASNPISRMPKHIKPRNRAASDTPSRVRLDTTRSGLPRLRMQSTGMTGTMTPPTFSPRVGPSSIPRPSRLSVSTSSVGTPTTTRARNAGDGIVTPRARTTSRIPSAQKQLPAKVKTYVADPKSKLDVAVGRIVNTLNVNVPIRPVGVGVGQDAAADEWKDQSGKYWIGAEGRAKLCFCRILRSRTVMVRVGGGWVELSKFLLDHFADSMASWVTPTGGLGIGIGIGSSTPVPITSASLSTPARNCNKPHAHTHSHTPSASATNAQGAVTPIRQAMPLPTSLSDRDLLTPQRDSRDPVLSPGSSGGGSPLVPLQFIRKASDSPEIRSREKQQLKAGRRSILGRQNSGLG